MRRTIFFEKTEEDIEEETKKKKKKEKAAKTYTPIQIPTAEEPGCKGT